MRNSIAIPWYGGKYKHLPHLLPLFPSNAHHYVEPFGGGATVLLNLPPHPLETYNDLDGGVVQFFRALRDRGDELHRALELTPYSREEFALACAPVEDGTDDVERARRFYVRLTQGFSGVPNSREGDGSWAYCIGLSRRGMAAPVSKHVGKVALLPEVVARLRAVQVENKPALDIIKRYDSPDTLFYIDPPYLPETRVAGSVGMYRHEMSDDDHMDLLIAVREVEGRVLLSGYRNKMYDERLNMETGWWSHDLPEKCATTSLPSQRPDGSPRVETVWMNYQIF